MTLDSFQRFIETFCPSACVPVDLVKIARNVLLSNIGPRVDHDFRYQPPEIIPSPLCLVMDGECCLDRLYGGFFGDWVCGGQWNRMVDFLRTFFEVVNKRNIELTVFFNGALEPHRMCDWIEKQKSEKEKITQVLRHTSCKGTPPPKVWWVAPCGLRTCLRILLRHLKVNVVLTTTDHHHEVMSYLKKNNYHGLLADDPEYIVFDPPRYFSSIQLKLTFKGCLETKEYILNEVTRCLNLHPSRICIVAALLGNHIINDADLASFHRSLCPDTKGKIAPNTLIKAIVDYVRNLPSVDDLNEVAWQVFGSPSDERCEKFKQCVLYYCRGNRNIGANISNPTAASPSATGNSYLLHEMENLDIRNNKFPHSGKCIRAPLLPTPGYITGSNVGSYFQNNAVCGKSCLLMDASAENIHMKEDSLLHSRSKFASETDESEMSNLQSIRQVLGKSKHGAFYQLLSNQDNSDCDGGTSNFNSSSSNMVVDHKDNSFRVETLDNTGTESVMESASLKHNCDKSKNISQSLSDVLVLPKVSTEVMRMARERHQKGLMHPYIFQILTQAEIKIPVIFEDESGREFPSPSLLYRPLRQMIYALLFNQHHLQYLAEQKREKEGIEEKVPDIFIREWIWSKSNKYNKPDLVPSMPLGWPVPTVSRLWFGSGPDDNKKRLQAFLTCMRSNTPLMCDPVFVPRHLILLCCVLRYIITSADMPFLYKHELDAFLVQAMDPHLMDIEHTQKLEVPLITPRGIMLAAIFMQGVEHALIANDACGAPISWLMCCPWLFFDGKLFHRKLLKANGAKNLLDLCDNRYDEVAAVEQMRSAIVEGLAVKFLTTSMPATHRPQHIPFPNFPVPVQPVSQGRGRGNCCSSTIIPSPHSTGIKGSSHEHWNHPLCSELGHQRVVPRGGQLEVAGVVVGSWGPNYGQGPRSPSRSIPPQIVSVGGVGRGRAVPNHAAGRGAAVARGYSPPTRPRVSSPPAIDRSPPPLGIGRGSLLLQGAKTNSPKLDLEI